MLFQETYLSSYKTFITFDGSCALSGKMFLVKIVENDKIDDYLQKSQVNVSFTPQGLERD